MRLTLNSAPASFCVMSNRWVSVAWRLSAKSDFPEINRSTAPRSATESEGSVLSTVSKIALLVVFMGTGRDVLVTTWHFEEAVGQSPNLFHRDSLTPKARNRVQDPAGYQAIDRRFRDTEYRGGFRHRVGPLRTGNLDQASLVIETDSVHAFDSFHARTIAFLNPAK